MHSMRRSCCNMGKMLKHTQLIHRLGLRTGNARCFAQFAGLRSDVELTQDPEFHDAASPLPVLRLIDEDGRLIPGAKLPFTLEEAVGMYKTMVRASVIDMVMNALQRQGRISFYMTHMGEEATTVGSAAALSPDDPLFPQYREMPAFLQRGFTIQQIADQCLSKESEPGKGRQMPIHYCDANLQIHTVSSPLATQVPHAVGAGYAFRVGGEQRCAVTYFGDGAASEGDFPVSLNFAATLKAQTLFICRNNGWAISTPASEQYVGDGIAIRGIAYGMKSIRVDGNDLAAVYLATQKARAYSVENGEPALLELMTYRRGHHSTSDDATRYRGGDTKSLGRQGLEPISRIRFMLSDEGLWDDERDKDLQDATREEVMSALKIAEGKKFAPVEDMFTDVWAAPTPKLQQQQQELSQHIEKHRASYAQLLQKFATK